MFGGKQVEKVVVKPIYIEKHIPIKARPQGLNLLDLRFEVVSHKNLEKFLEDNKKRNGVIVFIALDISEYEALAINMADIVTYIEQQKAIIIYYEGRIQPKEEDNEQE